MQKVLFAAVLIVCLNAPARGDLPMHCLRDQVIGTWDIEIGDETVPMEHARSFDCGLAAPKGPVLKAFQTKRTLTVKLDLPYIATASDGTKGYWTMIYDEGVEIRIGGKKYFAYFKYHMNTDGTCTSTCSETVNGYVHNDDRSGWGCWKATRKGAPQTYKAYPPAEEEQETLNEAQVKAATEEAIKELRPVHVHAHAAPYLPETNLVDAINALQTEYTAKVYPEFHGKTLAQLTRMAGGRSHKASNGQQENIMSFLQMDAALNEVHNHDEKVKAKAAGKDKGKDKRSHGNLPTAFDWRNVNGVNFMLPAVNQGDCGSCYAVAVADMITARVAVQTNNSVRVAMAAQELLSCGEKWNQGCDGGFPFLASKYVADFGLTSQECYNYEEAGFNAPKGYGNGCKLDHLAAAKPQACKYRVRAAKYDYIGGCYGCANEMDMMQEIYENGPIVVGFQVTMPLMHYNSGIFLDIGSQLPSSVNPWEETNHAVVVVGWGVSPKGTKYWTVKNSWGEHWGDHGYFYVQRGNDVMAFESMAVSALPIVTKAHNILAKDEVLKKKLVDGHD